MERTKIITNSGFKYCGEVISKSDVFIELIDDHEGKIKIPIVNISFMKEMTNG